MNQLNNWLARHDQLNIGCFDQYFIGCIFNQFKMVNLTNYKLVTRATNFKLVDYRSGKSHLARSGNSSCPLKKFILPARENIVQIKFLRKLKLIIPCCDDEEHSPSEFYCHGETNDPANATFQEKTPNKTTVRKMLQALFLQHFNGFILHGTFVVCQEIYIIFSKIKFFSFGVLLLFCCYSKCTARIRQYIRLKVAATKVLLFGFFLQSQNKLRSNKARSVQTFRPRSVQT